MTNSTLTEGVAAAGTGNKTAAFLYRVFDADRPTAPSARFCLATVDEVIFGRSDAR